MTFTRNRPIDTRSRAESGIPSTFPLTLHIGNFAIAVETITRVGSWGKNRITAKGVSGRGWVRFDCGGLPQLPTGKAPLEGCFRIRSSLRVVSVVSNAQTEIGLSEARLIRPEISLGETLELDLDLSHSEFQGLVNAERGVVWRLLAKKGTVLVKFSDVTVKTVDSNRRIGEIIEGKAVYPVDMKIAQPIRLALDGFTGLVYSLTLTPAKATANIILQLPSNIASDESCRAATLDLGETGITPDCQFYVERPDRVFGPWIVGDTGMLVSGEGFIADFSSDRSPLTMVASWKGVLLKNGDASGEKISPANSNTGFINGRYGFNNALITSEGMKAEFNLEQTHTFKTLNPLNYTIEIEDCKLSISQSRIVSGLIGEGTIAFPVDAIREKSGTATQASFLSLAISQDLDIVGEVDLGDARNVWGELTHAANEIVVWSARMRKGYVYLPSWTSSVYTPDMGLGFHTLNLPYQPSDAMAYLESEHVTGVTVVQLGNVEVYSADRPNGTSNPIIFASIDGWMRIGTCGADGELFVKDTGGHQELGNVQRDGYVGRMPFSSNITVPPLIMVMKGKFLLGQYVTSAVYDSGLSGTVKLSPPCDMTIDFSDMEFSSTADLVGGDVALPSGGVCLDYWKLQLVPTGNPNYAGVISVRTGRLIFTAAGIYEKIHFAEPFRLTWGEILADGNIGELFFDYNNYGQRFDGFQFSPQHLNLSKYTSDPKDAYFAACGIVSFSFFGECYINIKDARYDNDPNQPFYGRYVTVPNQVEAVCSNTDLHLHGEWNNQLAVFDFPDADMEYNEKIQEGFIGEGTADVNFLPSDHLKAEIEMHKDATNIGLSYSGTQDLDFGLFSRVGGMSGLAGCVRIEGPTLKQFEINGYLESSAATGFGIIEPKAGFTVEVLLSITPTTCTFMASGDIVLAVGGAAVDISGYVSLKIDYKQHSAEGEFQGIINCSSVLGGLEGTGQVTWFIDPNIQYLQGRITMKVCGWTGAAGFEGGLFIGRNVPKEKAWVLLYTGSEHFGISERILPSTLTGLYGYGMTSMDINWGFVSGGCKLFAGMGAFADNPGLSSSWTNIPGLPYVVGSCGINIYGEILWGLVSASAWATLDLRGPPPYFEGQFGLSGCILWVLCASIEITAGFNSDGFYAEM